VNQTCEGTWREGCWSGMGRSVSYELHGIYLCQSSSKISRTKIGKCKKRKHLARLMFATDHHHSMNTKSLRSPKWYSLEHSSRSRQPSPHFVVLWLSQRKGRHVNDMHGSTPTITSMYSSTRNTYFTIALIYCIFWAG